MAYEMKREESPEIKIGEKVYKVQVGGLSQLERYFEIERKMRLYSKSVVENPKTETLTIFGQVINDLMVLIFGNETTEALCAFYENNYDEMMKQVMPFVLKEWLPAINRKIDAVSQAKLKEALK